MAARARWRTELPHVSARRLAFAILVEGAQPEQVAAILQWCGLTVPPMKTVYDEMRDLPANNRDGAQVHAGKERAAPPQHDRILRWELGPSKERETLPFFGHERPNGGDN